MPCPLDPRLRQLGIEIDRFRVKSRLIFLTHAHADHTAGLKAWARRPRAGALFATAKTLALAAMAEPGLDPTVGRPLTLGVPQPLADGLTVTALPAYHAPGSCMLLFELPGTVRILYTGDFRHFPALGLNPLLRRPLDTVYYDDMFEPVTAAFPSPRQSATALARALDDCPDAVVHAPALGPEPLLLATGRRFRPHPSLPDWRRAQLQYLLGDRWRLNVEDDADAVAVGQMRRAGDDQDDRRWIVPTCTAFLCPPAFRQRAGRVYVMYCTHSNRAELEHFRRSLRAQRFEPCGESRRPSEFTCNVMK